MLRYIGNYSFSKLAFYDALLYPFGYFCLGTKKIDTVRKSPLFVTVLGSGSAAKANVYEVSEPRVESWNKSCLNDIKFWEVSGNPKKQANSESSLSHVEPRNLPRSRYLWPRWSGPLDLNWIKLLDFSWVFFARLTLFSREGYFLSLWSYINWQSQEEIGLNFMLILRLEL